MKKVVLAGLVSLGLGVAAQVQAQESSLAQVGLQSRIEHLSKDSASHGFELGLLTALGSIEGMLQARYRYGMGDRLMALPMLRVELGARNPRPETAPPEALAKMMRAVLEDLDRARGHLEEASSGQIAPFELTLQDVWFDVNANGQRDRGEDALEALAPILLGRRALRDMRESGALERPLIVRFDAADHAWLTAYTHMLSGVGSLFLAFDPSPVLRDLAQQRRALERVPQIENTFDPVALAAVIEGLELDVARLEALLEPLRARERALVEERRGLKKVEPRDQEAIAAVGAQLSTLRLEEARPLRQEIRGLQAEIEAARAKLESPRPGQLDRARNDIDAIYVVLASLRQVPDAERVAAARAHWMQMIAQNKVFWRALGAETDDENEWIPNPQQSSALSVQVSAEMAQSWQAILEDAEALLEGRLLIPHPLLPAGTGISLKAYVDDPGPLDLLEWVHGIGSYRYAARGPLITRQRWLAFQRLTRGNAGGFALFFN